MALFLDIGPDDVLRVGEDAYLTIEKHGGQRARLRIVGSAKVEMTSRPKPKKPRTQLDLDLEAPHGDPR